MTDYQNKTHKTDNKENKKNDIDRPHGRQNDRSVEPKFENYAGKPTK